MTFYRSALCSFLCSLVFLTCGSTTLWAQTASPAPALIKPIIPAKPVAGIILNEQVLDAQLQHNFYVIPDPEKNLSIRMVNEKFTGGDISQYTATSPLINLGLTGMTHWIVLPVTNVSSSELWELDFGDSASGRMNFLNRVSVYSGFSNKAVFDSSPSGHSPYSISNKVRLNIPVGQSSTIIIEARNPSGAMSILNLGLRRAYYADGSPALHDIVMARIPLVASIILLTTFLLRREFSYAAFGAAWFLIWLHHYMVDHYIFVHGFSAQLFTPGLWLVISLLLIGGFWLCEKVRREVPASLFMGIGFLSLICGLISLLVTDFLPVVGSVLSYGPIGIAGLIMVALGLLLVFREHEKTYLALFFTGLCLLLTIACISLVTYQMVDNPSPFLKAAHLSLCAAAIFTSLFALLTAQTPIIAMRDPEEIPVFKSAGLAEAKENAEHKRLLKVLDQERAMMADMQVQEARRTEEMRKAKEMADEANNAKSAFLAVVSHEIRTPMTGIMGMVRLMLDTSLSKDQREYATTIQDSGEALMALLNDILDFEKIESGKLELEHVDFDLHRLLRGIQTLMNGHAAAKGVELRLELDGKVPSFVVGDPTRLRQILLNLVNNAIKFTPAKGAVYLRAKDLTPEDKADSAVHQIYLAVQDSGIGITPDVQKRLFMPFAQADSSTARKYGGTGLGLAICKRLVEVMGGAINISSKPNEGSTFFFTLGMPLGQEGMAGNFAAAAAGIVEPPKVPQKPLNVLVVDDNGINQKVLTGLIEKDGHRVVTAGSGTEALGKYLAGVYDLVLMDLELPDKNGLEVTQEIRLLRDQSKAAVPIVAMTGNTSEKDVAACFSAGMDDFLGKPITPEKLKKILYIAGGNGNFANQVQKELRQSPGMATAAPFPQAAFETNYVPAPPPASNLTYIPVPPPAKKSPDIPMVSSISFDLPDDDEEEDTFATAIQKFEEIEQKGTRLDSDLDEAMLDSLKSSLTVAQLEDILSGFYEKAEELVTSIGQAFLQSDFAALSARAHELKGMAGNFGFKGVSSLSAQIEKAAKDKNEPELKAPVERLAETYALSKARLVAWLAE